MMIECITICICTAIVSLCILGTYYMNYKIDKLNIEYNKEELYLSIDISSCYNILDNIVEKEFNDYQKFHPDMLSIDSYIKSTDIQNIISEITTRVYVSITPAIYTNISIVYDINTKEKLINLIGEKVSILVMALAATINSNMIDDSKLS